MNWLASLAQPFIWHPFRAVFVGIAWLGLEPGASKSRTSSVAGRGGRLGCVRRPRVRGLARESKYPHRLAYHLASPLHPYGRLLGPLPQADHRAECREA